MKITISSPTKVDADVFRAGVDGAFVLGAFGQNLATKRIQVKAEDAATMERVANLKNVIAQTLSAASWFRKPVDIIMHFMREDFAVDETAKKLTEDGATIMKITAILISSRSISMVAKPIELSESINENTIEELKDIATKVNGGEITLAADFDDGSDGESESDDDDELYEQNLREMIQSAKARAVMAKMEARRLEAEQDELYGDDDSDGDDDEEEGDGPDEDEEADEDAGEPENRYLVNMDDDIEELQ